MAYGKILPPVVLIAGIVGWMQPVQAATVTYCGPNVCYQYDSGQAAVAWFGLPSFIGDSAYFLPTVFEARSADGVGIHSTTNTDVADATFVFSKVYTVSTSNEIASLWIHEEGDHEINYAAGEVHADLYVLAKGLNNLIEPSMIATDSFDQIGAPFGLQPWSMDATLTPAATLTQLANNMSLTIQNTLSAFTSDSTGGSELAWIEKKLVLDITTTTPVPVPAGLWLLGSALGVLAVARRRRLVAV